MSFLNSAILGALSLLAIPLIIHLINRRKAIEHRFAAFDFLMRSKIESTRRFRLKHLLLFLIRTLLVLCIVLGAAMPVIYGKAWKRKNVSGKMLIVLDNSASMHYIEDSVSGYKAGLRFLGNYLEQENISNIKVYPLIGREKEVTIQGFEGEFEKVMKDFPLTNASGNFGPVLKRAVSELRNDESYERMVIVSDFATSNFRDIPDSLFRDLNTSIVLARTSSDTLMKNIGLTEITVKSAPENRGLEASVFITNSTASAINDFSLGLFVAGKNVLNGFASLFPGKSIKKDFLIDGGEGEAPGEIRIASDKYSLDDTRYFVFSPIPPTHTLAVDGDQGAHYTASETFFLERALLNNRNAENLNRVVPPDGFNKTVLKDCKVLFLCNYIPPTEEIGIVNKFVEDGGGLFVSLGDRVSVEDFNQRLGPLFKRSLRDRKSGLGHKSAVEGHLVVSEPSHPAVSILNNIKNQEKYIFNDLYLLEPTPESGTETLLKTSTGEPLMLLAKSGKGLAILYLSTVDMAWNDFPMRPFFLPFIRETLKFLSGAREQVLRDTVYVNDTIKIPLQGTVRIDDPEGKRHILTSKGNIALFTETGIPGQYHIVPDKADGKWVSVNVSPIESMPERLTDARFSTIFAGSAYSVIDVRKDTKAETLKPRPLWHYFFLLAIILALLEALLCRPDKIERKK